ncbi:bifunctional phosphoribosylaminoimidazolecarboxamide formyltransferase/IMP cyclohydrolase [Bacillaceae bacterium S4-13-58]
MGQRALLSVSDKTGIVDFAKGLVDIGYELVSTGGTARSIAEVGLPVTKVEDVTGFPEILEGRVKTLHPFIHSGLLAKQDDPAHLEQLRLHEIEPFHLVVVNLYPFEETIAKDGVSEAEAIEQIDIGGPSMLRAAAKNFASVGVVVEPSDYAGVLEELSNGGLSLEKRRELAAKVFRHTAYYDSLVASYMTELVGEEFPEKVTFGAKKVQSLRYGENPHQKAAFYQTSKNEKPSIAGATQRNGKELSYNNIQDANAALMILREFDEPAAVAVKHMNPCGVGTGSSILEAYQRAYDADPVSIFGGIVALNREVDEQTALLMKEIFLEIIIAPKFSEEALEVLTAKKNLRLLEVELSSETEKSILVTTVNGGFLLQDVDKYLYEEEKLAVPTKRNPTDEEMKDLLFAWKIVKHVKSNAIVLAKDGRTIGVGAGQMNRVGAAKIALEQAGDLANGSALASDAFFPMRDTVEAAAAAGVTTIIQPGGSIRDEDSIQACDEFGIAMVFTGMRHFKH